MIKEIFTLQNPWRYKKGYTFNYFPRKILKILIKQVSNPKIIGLVGSRQVGKSSLLFLLIQHVIKKGISKENIFYFNLDDIKLQELFTDMAEFVHFLNGVKEQTYVFIDEIQRLENPGLFLKELYDLKLPLKVFYSGSSQLEIKSKVKEYGVGRIRQFEIERLSLSEYCTFAKPITKNQALTQILIYGSYPEIAQAQSVSEKKLLLKDIYQNYIQKDIVDFLRIKKPNIFTKFLGLLAHQSGGLLSVDTLAKYAGIPRKEIEKNLDILEQTYIIKRIYPFHKNYKKEITKTPKVYFLDTGLRNFILNNFNDLETRSDTGILFETFYLQQLMHDDPHRLNKVNFWRTTNQTEIDFIISKGDSLHAFEVKYSKSSPPKAFTTLRAHYPGIQTEVITRDTFAA